MPSKSLDGISVELASGLNLNVLREAVRKELLGRELVIILVTDSLCCGVLVKM